MVLQEGVVVGSESPDIYIAEPTSEGWPLISTMGVWLLSGTVLALASLAAQRLGGRALLSGAMYTGAGVMLLQLLWVPQLGGALLCGAVALTTGAMAIVTSLILAYADGPDFAVGIGYCNAVGNVGSFLGPLVLGWSREASGHYTGGLVGVGGALLVAGMMCFLAPRVRQH